MADPFGVISIGIMAKECEELFQRHLSQVGDEFPLTQRLVAEYQEQFEAWTILHVFREDRKTLDHRLRHALEVKGLVLQQLHVLARNLNAGM